MKLGAFLLDEGVPKAIHKALSEKGHDVRRVQDLGPRGISNNDLLELSVTTGRILLTRDADFLKLSQAGQTRIRILYLEAYPDEPTDLAKHVETHIEKCLTLLEKCYIVILRIDGPECLRA